MSLPRETDSSDNVLRDARYHRAATKADPETAHLAERVETAERTLRTTADERDAAEDARVEAYARVVRTDFELDRRTRHLELQVLVAVDKNRSAPPYRACFPRGMSDLIAMRGVEQERGTRSLVDALGTHFPALATEHGPALLAFAEASVTAERAWRETERLVAVAWGAERVARVEVIRALQRNAGALGALFPGDKPRTRSFFRSEATRRPAPSEPADQ